MALTNINHVAGVLFPPPPPHTPKDAYVAYCDADTEFVCRRLQAELQKRRGVHLLIKDLPRRDDDDDDDDDDDAEEEEAATTQQQWFWQLPGDNVAEKMLEHMDLCWKVVLLVTPALARDPLAGFVTRSVLQSVTDRMPDRVLLLCVGVGAGVGGVRSDVTLLPALASLRALLDTVWENQVFFLPARAGRDHPAWDRMAHVILN